MQPEKKPLVIPVFIPHSGCPNMCAFCNQSIITNAEHKLPQRETIIKTVDDYLKYKGNRSPVQLAFFGGNFLGLEPSYILDVLSLADTLTRENKIDSARFSTRPDTISEKTLDLIKGFPVSTIELGVQSMNDDVLELANRGHNAQASIDAVLLLKKRGYETGIQMMVGLPGDNEKTILESTKKILMLGPDFIRIYPLIVLKGSLIAKWYKDGMYKPLSLDECVFIVKKIYTLFNEQNIPVIRIGLQASEMLQDKNSMIAGPWHPAFGHLVLSEMFYDKAVSSIQKILEKNPVENLIILNVHPSSESKLRGDKNNNLQKIKNIFPKIDFEIHTDALMNKESVKAEVRSLP